MEDFESQSLEALSANFSYISTWIFAAKYDHCLSDKTVWFTDEFTEEIVSNLAPCQSSINGRICGQLGVTSVIHGRMDAKSVNSWPSLSWIRC